MKKTLSVILSLIMLCSMFALDGVAAAETPTSGTFGDLRWSYSEYDNELWISSINSNQEAPMMINFTYSNGSYNRPWESFADEIKSITIHNVFSIGNYAFVGCENLEHVLFLGSVSIIGQGAFQSCVSLESFYCPTELVAIGPSAFEGCTSLDLVTMERKVAYVGDNAFEGCPIEYTIYSGTPDQEEVIYFEDNTESLKNVLHANVQYDISVQVGEYEVLSVVSLEPFTFKSKNSNVATILKTQYDTVTEGGVDYYIGAAAVSGVGDGITSIYALDNNKEIIGAFSVIVGKCASAHSMTKQYYAIEPTCSRGGYFVHECERCSHKETEYKQPTPHSFVYETVAEATCLTGKVEKGVCSVCQAETERIGSANGHNVTYVTQKEATCQEPGLRIGKCEDCGDEFEGEIPQLDHNWTDWVVTVAPTEETEGKKERHCIMCEEKQTEVIPILSTMMGDVNGDGKVSAFDARIVLQFAAETKEMDEHQFRLADINEDGKITAFDARRILQIAANS